MFLSAHELARVIDHTLLKPDASEHALVRLCEEAAIHDFLSVCVQPCRVELARTALADNKTFSVLVCTVIGFPHGANTTATKIFEVEEAMADGARELDMVINLGAVKSAAWKDVEAEIAAVVTVAQAGGAAVKVIIECASLTEAEKRQAAEIVAESGAAFVKTSTGYGPHGATMEDVRLLREVVGDRCGVKAAGGIRDLPTALAMLEAGATRLGTSAGVTIVETAHQSETNR